MNIKRGIDSIFNGVTHYSRINYTNFNGSSLFERCKTRLDLEYDFLSAKLAQEDPDDYSYMTFIGINDLIDPETGTSIYFLKLSNYG